MMMYSLSLLHHGHQVCSLNCSYCVVMRSAVVKKKLKVSVTLCHSVSVTKKSTVDPFQSWQEKHRCHTGVNNINQACVF